MHPGYSRVLILPQRAQNVVSCSELSERFRGKGSDVGLILSTYIYLIVDFTNQTMGQLYCFGNSIHAYLSGLHGPS